MTYKVWYEEKMGIVHIVNYGPVTLEDFKNQAKECQAYLTQYHSKLVLVDNSHLITDIGVMEIYGLPGMYHEINLKRDTRIAVYTLPDFYRKEDLKFYEMICKTQGYIVRLFFDKTSARNWLVEKVSQVQIL